MAPRLDAPLKSSTWRIIYLLGGIAALAAVLFFRRNTGTELMAFKGFGIFNVPEELPSRAVDWFTLFYNGPSLGLALFDFIDVINYALVGLIFLALYGAQRDVNKRWMVGATALAFFGTAIAILSHQALAMLSLSSRYESASTDAQRALIVAAAEARLAIHNPGASFPGAGYFASLFLVLLAGLIISIVMLRSAVFWRATAYAGILANGLALLYFPALIFAPALVWLPPTTSAVFRMAWYILIAIGLFRLGRTLRNTRPEQEQHSPT